MKNIVMTSWILDINLTNESPFIGRNVLNKVYQFSLRLMA